MKVVERGIARGHVFQFKLHFVCAVVMRIQVHLKICRATFFQMFKQAFNAYERSIRVMSKHKIKNLIKKLSKEEIDSESLF